ncbi:MAG TPA: hypothetical protein VN238_11240, partial [Solirubrobacteraceae bacterium]|nr:hypothetical protein [Solirubrobacteraceae bacterium]
HARRVAAVAPAARPAPLISLTAPAQALVKLAGVGEIPNADALTDGAVAVRIGEKDVAIPFAAAADQARFKPENLPIPLGPEAPSPAPGDAPFSLAVRDARQTLNVLRKEETRTNIAALRSIEEALEELDKVSGTLKTFGRIDVDEALFDQLTGTTTVTREANATVVRAELEDGGPLRTALDRIAKVPAFAYELAGIDGVALDRQGDEAFVLKLEGEKPVRLAVLDKILVATTSPAVGLRAVANREPGRVTTPGALHARLTRPGELLVQRFGLPGATSVLLGGLGPLDLAVQAERTGLTGSATLTVAR